MDLHRPVLCRSVGTQSYSICMEFRQCPRIQSWTCIGLYSIGPWVAYRILQYLGMEFRQCPRISVMDLHRPLLCMSVGTACAWSSGNVPEFQSWTCRHEPPIFCRPVGTESYSPCMEFRQCPRISAAWLNWPLQSVPVPILEFLSQSVTVFPNHKHVA